MGDVERIETVRERRLALTQSCPDCRRRQGLLERQEILLNAERLAFAQKKAEQDQRIAVLGHGTLDELLEQVQALAVGGYVEVRINRTGAHVECRPAAGRNTTLRASGERMEAALAALLTQLGAHT
jgi:hypothetical protein